MPDYFIHPSAEMNSTAIVGNGTKIWNNAQIRENVIIGVGCIISKNVYVDYGVKIGDRVKIQNNVNIYHGVTIEDDVFLGPSMTFTNDMYPRAFISDFEVYHTIVKKGASIGANATVLCGVTVNSYALVGAGSVVIKDVPAHGLVVGNPARLIGFVCVCGHKLNKQGECPCCHRTIPVING